MIQSQIEIALTDLVAVVDGWLWLREGSITIKPCRGVPELTREDSIHPARGTLYIAPESRKTRLISRRCKASEYEFSFAIMLPLTSDNRANTTDDEAVFSKGQQAADLVIDSLLGKRLGGELNLMCTSVDQVVTTSVEHWREKRMFATFLRVRLET